MTEARDTVWQVNWAYGNAEIRSKSLLVILFAALLASPSANAQSMGPETARSNGQYRIERQGIVERSDIVLQSPNEKPSEAMPLGNGRLGVAVWAEDGLTAQLNRGDTFPARLSPGQAVIPGLKKLVAASDYKGRLNLYHGEFEESGGGMRATVYVDENLDVMVIDVEGADPQVRQSATLQLWAPRQPQVMAHGAIGILAETWLDDREAGASDERFGSLAAITADAQDVVAHASDGVSVTITFKPHPDGMFRVFVGAPSWRGGDAAAAAAGLLRSAKSIGVGEHRAWWKQFWDHAGLMKLSSPDHAAEYFENLRMIDLFTAAAESRGRFPGGQAGIGDLFSSARDDHKWGPSAFWHWNLRMQVSANLGAGVPELNAPYFRLYRENLDNMLLWTRKHMGNKPGICIPETMRFNGRGYENETWLPKAAINCGEDSQPYYNARTISTGAEVSLWIWNQYEYTNDLVFLKENYPVMRESARFLLAYAKPDSKGMLHTFPANAHETQWDVHDPTTDIAAMRAVFPLIIEAATLLKTDADLVRELRAEIGKIPELPLTTISSPKVLVRAVDGKADTIIASSFNPEAEDHNTENIGLEPVWPYGLIGDDGPQHELGVRTFLHRPFKNVNDWSYDPVQAARLGLAEEVKSSLLALTEQYQAYPSGFSKFVGNEFYVEQVGIVADALQEALVQDYDGLIRIAPAWPKDWDADGMVYLGHKNRADVRIRRGRVVSVGLEMASAGVVRIRNPWPAEGAEIVDAGDGSVVLPARSDAVLTFTGRAATNYVIRPAGSANAPAPFEGVSGVPATAPKFLGTRTMGLQK